MSNIIKYSRAGTVSDMVIDSNSKADAVLTAILREREEKERAEREKKWEALKAETGFKELDLAEHSAAHNPADIEAEARRKAEEIIANANEQKEIILNQAFTDARLKTEEIKEEASIQGYREGFNKATEEFEAKNAVLKEEKERLEKEYREELERLEPRFAELVISYVERLTGILASDYEDVIYNMIVSAIDGADPSKKYIIHVPKEQYEYVSSRENYVRELIGEYSEIEVVSDSTLPLNACKIETDSCIIDTGLDTRLNILINSLKLLAGDKENG